MCYQENPDSVVWLVMDDGTLRSLTYVPAREAYQQEDEVMGWGRHDMGPYGAFESCCCIREADGTDRVYFVVSVNTSQPQSPTITKPIKMIVAMQDRDQSSLEDQFFVDCGVSYDGRQNNGIFLNCGTYSDATHCALDATAPIFTAAMVGKVLRLNNPANSGVPTAGSVDALITGYTSATEVSVTLRNATNQAYYTSYHYPTKQWSWLTQTINGLSHLEGQQVAVLVDGCVVSSPNNPKLKKVDGTAAAVLTVSGGVVDFSATGVWGEVVHAGLPYVCDIETL
jgi:hypothetical protein